MADLHVSASGSNTAPYETWAKAATSLLTAISASAAGDTIYIDSAFTQSAASSLAFPGSLTSPNRVLVCTHSGASGADALATGAVYTYTAGGYGITGGAYIYGLGIVCSAASSTLINLGDTTNTFLTFDNCAFSWTGAGNSYFQLGATGAASNKTLFKDCTFKFAAANQRLYVSGTVEIVGGSWLSGGTSPTGVFHMCSNARGSLLSCTGFDFSNLSSSFNLVQDTNGGNFTARFAYCKLPSSWSGSLWAGSASYVAPTLEMISCGNGSINYDVNIVSYEGSIVDETTIVMSGGASDGTTTFSRKMASVANAEYPTIVLRSPPMLHWVDSTGSALTATVEFVHDTNVAAGQGAGTSYAFQDDEVWLELQYLGTSGHPLGLFATTRKALLATAADITSSSVTWTTTGMTTPVKQKLSVSFTPQMKGYIIGRVCVAKASKTIYYNPVMVVE